MLAWQVENRDFPWNRAHFFLKCKYAAVTCREMQPLLVEVHEDNSGLEGQGSTRIVWELTLYSSKAGVILRACKACCKRMHEIGELATPTKVYFRQARRG